MNISLSFVPSCPALLSLTVIALSLGALSACDDDAALREWTPEDHVHAMEQAPQQTQAEVQPPPSADPAHAAAALWRAACAACHGQGGHGDGPGKPPIATIADFTSPAWQGEHSDALITQTIVEGRGLMPAFGEQINAAGVKVLVQHIRSLAAQPAPAVAGEPPQPQGS